MTKPIEIKEFLRELERQGIGATSSQLARWRRGGLMPAVIQRPLGRGLGSETLIDSHEVDRVRAIFSVLHDCRKLEAVRWRLWLRGFAIDESYWRADLVRAARAWNVARSFLIKKLNADSDNAFAKFANKLFYARGADRFFRQMRKAVGGERFSAFMYEIAQISVGDFQDIAANPEPSDPDRLNALKVLDAGLGLKRARMDYHDGGQPILSNDYSGTLRNLSAVLSTADLMDLAKNASADELLTARTELFALLDILSAASETLSQNYGKRAFGLHRIPLVLSASRTAQALMVLIWCAARRNSELRGQIDEILAIRPDNRTTMIPVLRRRWRPYPYGV